MRCLPRKIPDDAAFDVHLKRRLVNKPSYKKGLVKKSHIHAWLKHLETSLLYKYLKIKIDWSRRGCFEQQREEECHDGKVTDDNDIKPALEVTDLEDPLQAVVILNVISHTMVIDDEGIGLSKKKDDDVTEDQGIMAGTHSFRLAPGEGQTPISLLFDEWLRRRHSNKLWRCIAKLEREIEAHTSTLERQQWGQIYNSLNGQLGWKKTWHLLRHLLDPGNTKSATLKQLTQIIAESLAENASRYINTSWQSDMHLPPNVRAPNEQLDADISEGEDRFTPHRLRMMSVPGLAGVT
ncbi:hypothetical protein HPB49_010918 [Dermacentor silvarum]|uniref:Uncharacterized protein n=1 Tax=Dermacentor silvarum TaxID=543639 RepID=A0ACB8D4V1_DERSI|nr:hypothetical protein HPB49_010918 [Dermacentor silvarum]